MFAKFEQFLLNLLAHKSKKLMVLLITLLAFILSVLMLPTELVLAKMLPGKNNNTFNIYVDLPTGSSIMQTKKVTDCVVQVLQHEREVTDVEVFLGMGSPMDYAGLMKGSQFKNSENVAEVVVNITNKHDRKEPSYLMVQRIRPSIIASCQDIVTNTSIKFIEPPAGPPVMATIVAELYGENTMGLRTLASRIQEVFKKTPGLVDIDIMQDDIYQTYKLEVNSVKVAKSGLSVKQVNDILYLAFEGMGVAVKNSKQHADQIPIFVMLSPKSKQFNNTSLRAVESKLASLKLMNQRGMMVPLTEMVKIIPVNSNPIIMSKNLHQMVSVVAETDMVSQVYPLLDARLMIKDTLSNDYDVISSGLVNLEIKDKKTGDIYKLKWDGEMKVTLDTFVDLGGAFIAALILIFLLMVVYYKSFVLSGIVLLGSFLSIIGVIVGHWIMDLFVSDTFFLTATSLIGYIALIGISSRNSLLLIDFTKQLMFDKALPKREAIAVATATRAKPIFLTAAAIILASTLLAGDAVFGGLGVALIFGTVAAVIASLLVVPVLMDNSDLKKHFNR